MHNDARRQLLKSTSENLRYIGIATLGLFGFLWKMTSESQDGELDWPALVALVVSIILFASAQILLIIIAIKYPEKKDSD